MAGLDVRRSIAILVTMVAVSSGCAALEPKAPRPSALPGAVLQRMLAEDADEHNAGAIALVKMEGRSWAGAAGGYQGKREAHPGDRFDIGSTGKTYVATVILQLVEEGRLSLDDSVERWLPGRSTEVASSSSATSSTTRVA